jgi:hypothetical protein
MAGANPGTAFRTTLLTALLLIQISAYALSAPLEVPLTVDTCPTSSFGSWRAGHLHGGLDFSIGGVTGVPVLAADTCRVWRLRIWHGGYGKALYVERRDGTVLVYGHLSRYNPALERLVEEEQDRRLDYEVEIYPHPGRFEYLPGDTLAYGGGTGSGPPHLHFEIRSGRGDHDKINPVPAYLRIPESRPPRIRAVRLVPLDPGCSFDGDYGPVTLRPGRIDTVRVSGGFGVCVWARDTGRCGRDITPTVYEAWIDDRLIWRLNLDRFPYARGHLVGALYDNSGDHACVRLFDPWGLNHRGFDLEASRPDRVFGMLPRGLHVLRVRVTDPWGNSDSVRVPFLYGNLSEFRFARLEKDSAGWVTRFEAGYPGGESISRPIRFVRVPESEMIDSLVEGGGWRLPAAAGEVECIVASPGGFVRTLKLRPGAGVPEPSIRSRVRSGWIEFEVDLAAAPESLPRLEIHEGSLVTGRVLQPIGDGRFRTVYVPRGLDQVVHAGVADGTGRAVTTHGRLVARLEPGTGVSLRGDGYVMRMELSDSHPRFHLIGVSEDEPESLEGLAPLGKVLRLEPPDAFFDERITIRLDFPGAAGRQGVGLFAVGESWTSMLGPFDGKGICTVELHGLSDLAVCADTLAPAIHRLGGIRSRADGKAEFSARISDRGSGVDPGSIRVYINGEKGIAGWDPDTGRVRCRTTKTLPPGEHRLKLEVTDRLGNTSSREAAVSLLR